MKRARVAPDEPPGVRPRGRSVTSKSRMRERRGCARGRPSTSCATWSRELCRPRHRHRGRPVLQRRQVARIPAPLRGGAPMSHHPQFGIFAFDSVSHAYLGVRRLGRAPADLVRMISSTDRAAKLSEPRRTHRASYTEQAAQGLATDAMALSHLEVGGSSPAGSARKQPSGMARDYPGRHASTSRATVSWFSDHAPGNAS